MKFNIKSKIQKYVGRTLKVVNQIVHFENIGDIEFEFVDRDEVALIIPLIDNYNVIVLNQYRTSFNSFLVEFPAGKKKRQEKIIDTAIRELKEETGYKTKKIEQIGSFYTAPHFTNEIIYVFIASELEFEKINYEEKEIITQNIVSINELIKLQRNNTLLDAKTSLALSILKNWKI